MLLETILLSCDKRHRMLQNKQCSGCSYGEFCPHNCEKCLDAIHNPNHACEGAPARKYDCVHMADVYTCKYSCRYTSEIMYALERCIDLHDVASLEVLSFGCGPCTDLFAIESLRGKSVLSFEEIEYRGVDYSETVWKNIHQDIQSYNNRNTKSNTKDLGLLPLETTAMYEMAHRMSEIALKYGIKMESCAEKINLDQFGIEHGHCIDCSLFERLLGCRLDLDKDKNQREECGCVASVDIGMYNTCKNGCKYCYANYSANTVAKHYASHNPESSLISGAIGDEDVVKDRVVKSCKDCQLNLF